MRRLIESAAVAAFALLAAGAAWRLAAAVDSPEGLALLALCAIAGWLAADFLSGLAHWAGDTWGGIRTPYFGRSFVLPFREHHTDPQAMTRHDFIETNGASCIAALPLLLPAALAPVQEGILAHALLLFTALGMLLANQCHKWAHTAPAGRGLLVRAAQRLRLVLPPEHHARHHARRFDTHYCTASGWMNVPLQAVGFFPALEYVIRKASGAVPRDPQAQ